MPWYTMTDSFDKDFGVDEWHGHNVSSSATASGLPHILHQQRGDEAMGTIWSYLDITPLGRQETWEDSPEGYPERRRASGGTGMTTTTPRLRPPKWVDIITDPEGAAAKAHARRKRAKEGPPCTRANIDDKPGTEISRQMGRTNFDRVSVGVSVLISLPARR